MGYRVDYELLDAMYDKLTAQATTWDQELNAVKTAIERLQHTENMSGVGADAARSYLNMVHIPLAETLINLVELHKTNFILYKTHYQQFIDTGFDTVIDEEELGRIMQSLSVMRGAAIDVDDEVRGILRRINDIFVTSFRSVSDVADVIGVASNMCSTLSQNIQTLESLHMQNAFVNTGPTIDLLTNEINLYLGRSRNFKTTYDPTSPENASTGNRLAAINSVLMADLDGKAAAVKAAVEHHESREEMENRIEAAKWEKLLVSAVVIVGSAVLIAALPVSGPLVVGLVSGTSSAILSANNEAMDLYIEDGNISGDDWNKVVVEGGKGFATGFVTGVVGGVTGKAVSGLTKGIPALQSTNTVVHTATHVVVGSTSEVVSGVVTRTAGEIVDQVVDSEAGVDWGEVRKEAFDPTEMGKDAVIGGVTGHIETKKVDWSESANTDYEKGVLDDMYKKGELEYTTDPELDALDVSDSGFADKLPDYTIKKKDNFDGLDPKDILSSDEYYHENQDKVNLDTVMDVNKGISKAQKIIGDDTFQSHDEIIYNIQNRDTVDAGGS